MSKSAADIRREFIEFFTQHGHTFVPGSPVAPYDDPTLLFTNAGMNQFKDVFLATGTRNYSRAANSQPCIRAGGKHNDLDDVGKDTYHHTFFEMLGNWSFGDYFKAEAIEWAWELLTKVWGIDGDRLHATYFEGDASEGLEPDVEARDLWLKILPPERVHAGSKKDNFWEMGETGPCGPCSEVHIDLSPDNNCAHLVNADDARVIEIWNLVFIQYNRDASGLSLLPAKHVDTGMGFERVVAVLQGKSSNYDTDVFTPIFEAIQKITSAPAYSGAASLNPEPRTLNPEDMIDVSYRVIADHARCLTFAINDGCMPDREGRGYVLRRILRRGVRYGWQYMNMHEPFLHKLVPAVVASLGEAFPQLKEKPEQIAEIIREEEEAFGRTFDRGLHLWWSYAGYAIYERIIEENRHLYREGGKRALYLDVSNARHQRATDPDSEIMTPESMIAVRRGTQVIDRFRLKDITASQVKEYCQKTPRLSGEAAFKLHDTYGFPIDLTEIMAEEKGLRIDIGEYERLMEEARERARAGGKTETTIFGALNADLVTPLGATDESSKYETDTIAARVVGVVRFGPNGVATLLKDGEALSVGDSAGLIFDKTCFYAEQGGQIGDVGEAARASTRFDVEDTRRFADTIVHFGTQVMGGVKVGDELDLTVNQKRKYTKQNHTATHLMNWALREVLGEHVQQKGSLVDSEKTRFDLSHPKAITPEEIGRVETLVNEAIQKDLAVHDQPVPQEQALKIEGLRAVFGEKYPDVVRVMSIGVPVEDLLGNPDSPDWRNISIEFCGGTHCRSTGQIENFAIVSEEAVAKGIRRVVGVTAMAAMVASELGRALLKKAEDLLAHDWSSVEEASEGGLAEQTADLIQEINNSNLRVVDRAKLRALTAELQKLVKKQQKQDSAAARDVVIAKVEQLLADAPKIGDTTVVAAEMPDVPIDELKTGADVIKQKCGSAAILFGVKSGDKAVLLAAVSNDLVKRGLKAGDLVKTAAALVKGGGGGPPTMAQAGGKDPEKLEEALEAGRVWIREKL